MSKLDDVFLTKEIHIWVILTIITFSIIIYLAIDLGEQHKMLLNNMDCDALTVIILDKEHQYVQSIQTLATEHYFMKCV